jgi:hypothetical protein
MEKWQKRTDTKGEFTIVKQRNDHPSCHGIREKENLRNLWVF